MKTAFVGLIAALLTCGAAAQTVVLSQNRDPFTIIPGNSIACQSGLVNNDNFYLRSFSFSDFGIASDFSISSVSFAIESANATLPLTVGLYAGTDVNNLRTPIWSSSFTIPPQSRTFYTLNLSALVPFAFGGVMMSVFSPNGAATNSRFLIGSNNAGQTGPSYLMAPACGIFVPTDIAALGFPNDHIIMSITGTPVPEPQTSAVLGLGGVLLLGLAWRSRRGRHP